MKPYYCHDGCTIYQGNCLDVMPQLEPGSVDLVLADIPYGTTACAWDCIIPFDAMWSAIKHVAKKNAAVVLFGSQPFTSALVMSNPAWFKYEWVWDKRSPTGYLNAKKRPMRQHENILVFFRQRGTYNPQLRAGVPQPFGQTGMRNNAVYGDAGSNIKQGVGYPLSILPFPRPNNLSGGGLHPTQKPVELMEYLIRTYSNAGDTVLDFTMGSGTTLVAAKQCNRRAIGIELDVDKHGKPLGYCDIAVDRLAQQVLVLD